MHRFSLRNKTFQFTMSDCYKEKNGTCPIEKGEIDTSCKCTELLKELEKTNWVFDGNLPVVVYHSECGHYSCVDGQHRLCIAGKLGKEVEIGRLVDASYGLCSCCAPPLFPNFTECQEFLEVF